MKLDADLFAKKVVQAFNRGDFLANSEVTAFPFGVYVDDQALILSSPDDAQQFAALIKMAAFRTGTREAKCELLDSKMIGKSAIRATVRISSPIRNKSVGNSVVLRIYMREIDGFVKAEMVEVVDYTPSAPIVVAFRQLSIPNVQDHSVSS